MVLRFAQAAEPEQAHPEAQSPRVPRAFVFYQKKSLKHFADTLYATDEGIDILSGVVDGEAGAASAFDTQAAHQGFGTMMTCTYGDAESVK